MTEGRAESSQRTSAGKPSRSSIETETLNFKVITAFKKEFKGYAVSQGMTMLDLMREGFELSKRKQ